MKKAMFAAMCVAVLGMGSAACADEGEATGLFSKLGVEVSGDVNFSTIYEWRGIMLDGDAVAQPGIYLRSPASRFGRVKVGFWMSRDLQNTDALKSSETDYILDYTYSFKDLDLSAGHTYYDFPDALPSDGAPGGFSREFYVGASLPKVLLAPSVYYYYDYGKKEEGGGQGSYTVVNAAYSIPFSAKGTKMSLDLNGHAGYNNKQYYRGNGGDFGMTAGVSVPLTSSLTVKPNVSYAVPWGNISDKNNGNQKSRVYSGVYMNYVF